MAQMPQTAQNVQTKQTTQTVQEQIQTYRKQYMRSTVLVMVAFFAIAVFAFAWVTGHKKTKDTSYTITSNDKRYEIYLQDGVAKDATDGTSTFQLISETQSLTPGAKGQIKMTLIPKTDDVSSIDLHMILVPYQSMDNSTGKLQELTQGDTKYLVFGHFLFFKEKDENDHYSGLAKQGIIQLQATDYTSETSFFEKDHPYEFSIYWIWPEYFQDMITWDSDQSLFDISNNEDRNALLDDMNDNPSNYFKATDITTSEKVNNKLSAEAFAAYNDAYNNADQQIGSDIQYVGAILTAQEN